LGSEMRMKEAAAAEESEFEEFEAAFACASLRKASRVSEGSSEGAPFSSASCLSVALTILSRARASAAASEGERAAEEEEMEEVEEEEEEEELALSGLPPANAHPCAPGLRARACGTPICAIVM
jgi:hypothetical protein